MPTYEHFRLLRAMQLFMEIWPVFIMNKGNLNFWKPFIHFLYNSNL